MYDPFRIQSANVCQPNGLNQHQFTTSVALCYFLNIFVVFIANNDEILQLEPSDPKQPKAPEDSKKDQKDKFDEITTLNDDANRNPGFDKEASLINGGSLEPQQTPEALSLRMSTTISGIIIGIVASIVIAILILIFAVYKYKNRSDISQFAIRIDTIKLDSLSHHHSSSGLQFDSVRTHPYSMSGHSCGGTGTPQKSIIKNGGGSPTAINTLTRASIDHLHDSKEWYV